MPKPNKQEFTQEQIEARKLRAEEHRKRLGITKCPELPNEQYDKPDNSGSEQIHSTETLGNVFTATSPIERQNHSGREKNTPDA